MQRIERVLIQPSQLWEIFRQSGWEYEHIQDEEDDEDMLEAGEDYQSIIKVPFKMVEMSD